VWPHSRPAPKGSIRTSNVLIALTNHVYQPKNVNGVQQVQHELDDLEKIVMVAGRKMILYDDLYQVIILNELKRPRNERVQLRLIRSAVDDSNGQKTPARTDTKSVA
jgi:hypothetical protein